MNLYGETSLVELVAPTNVTTTSPSVTSSVVDLKPFIGKPIVAYRTGGTQGTGGAIKCYIQTAADETVKINAKATADVDCKLRESTAKAGETLAAAFTNTTAATFNAAWLQLKRVGAVAAAKYLQCKIMTDDTGPSNTVVATSTTLDPSTVSTTYSYVKFTFNTPIDLAAATAYHMVLLGDYAASDTVYIAWAGDTVAEAGTEYTHNHTEWTNVTTTSPAWYATGHAWTNQKLTTVAATHSIQSVGWDLDAGSPWLRVKADVTAGDGDTSYWFDAWMLAVLTQK